MSDWAAKLQAAPKKISSPQASPENSPLPDTYNASDVLAFMSSQYNLALASSKQDKLGEKVRIYRSLDSSSAWTTKGPKRDEKAFNLLFEINRSMHQQRNKKETRS